MYIELLFKLFDKSVNKIVFWKLSTFTDQNNLLDASFKFVWENKGKLVKTESWSEMVGNYPDLIGKAFSQSMLQNSHTEQWFRFFKQIKILPNNSFSWKSNSFATQTTFPILLISWILTEIIFSTLRIIYFSIFSMKPTWIKSEFFA